MERIELLWKEKTDGVTDINKKAFELYDLLGIDDINTTVVDNVSNNNDDII
jgi:hypothetical protein